MIYQNKQTCSIYMNCNCGCGEGLEFQLSQLPDQNSEIFISLVGSKWYHEQDVGWGRLKTKFKKIWAVIRNKDYHYSELVLNHEQFCEFCEAVQRLSKNELWRNSNEESKSKKNHEQSNL